MKLRKANWIVLATALSVLAVLDSGCGVLDTIARGVLGLCARPEFVVTRDDDPRGGLCSPSNCSLRQAITLSNACTGVHTIRIPTGTYTLSISGRDEDANASGDLDILQSVTLVGDGRPGIAANEIDRVLEISSLARPSPFRIWQLLMELRAESLETGSRIMVLSRPQTSCSTPMRATAGRRGAQAYGTGAQPAYPTVPSYRILPRWVRRV